MKYKVLISDFDGTLACSDNSISQKNILAIRNFIKRGGKFALCSGRMTDSIIDQAKKIGVTGCLIAYNGAEMVDIETGNVLFKKHLNNKLLVEMLLCLEQFDPYIQTYTDKVVIDQIGERTNAYLTLNKAKILEAKTKLSNYFSLNKMQSAKILVFDTEQVVDKMQWLLHEKFRDQIQISRSNSCMLEITANGIDKKFGVKKLLEILQENKEDCVCVGDAGNDLKMLEYAGLGVAVFNSSKDVKDVADLVLEQTNDQDAIAYLIENYCI